MKGEDGATANAMKQWICNA
jgi:hypothetical protein